MSSSMMSPVDDIICVDALDIFNFDLPSTDSAFGEPWPSVEDPDFNDIRSNSLEDTVFHLPSDVSATTASTAAPISDHHSNSSRSLVRRGQSRSLSTRKSKRPAEPSSQNQEQTDRPANPSRGMNNYSSLLVEYYFKEVAGIFSCYDSHLNPFRSTVSKLWQTSNSVFYVLQSMSAACLSDVVPSMHAVGFKMRRAAMACIETDIRDSKVETGSLLTLIMLGLSASWHNPEDVGREQFEHARTIMGALSTGHTPAFLEVNNKRNLQFFQEAMIYWEMLLSYVSDVSMPIPVTQEPDIPDYEYNNMLEPSFPHPWTGVAREAQVLVFEVGRLSYKVINSAEELALKLQKLQLPPEQAIVSPGDAQTPVQHLLTIAELYRLTGLLQLYRVFPDLLADYGGGATQLALDFYEPHKVSTDGINQRLTSFAVEIVNLLRTLPIESATKCVQPFFFVAVASELRMPPMPESLPASNKLMDDDADPTTDETGPSAVAVLAARKFVISRLSTFEHVLPAKPLRQMIQIVTLTWEQIDQGMADVYWMDVMTEKGWETTLG
ncbi:hypothetical protein H2202_000006 [Exophiala xenobiotica]|nr:hypothetical protein H2202_000006 [Exophiala xenobiotica]